MLVLTGAVRSATDPSASVEARLEQLRRVKMATGARDYLPKGSRPAPTGANGRGTDLTDPIRAFLRCLKEKRRTTLESSEEQRTDET